LPEGEETQTTLRFDEDLMRRVKAEAAHQGLSVTRYIEGALPLSAVSDHGANNGFA
jgi:predicted DNA binding CopG/RHH family protein